MSDAADPTPGPQIERTHLAWERTAFGYLAVTAVLLFPSHGPVSQGRAALAALSIVLSLTVVTIAQSRGRITASEDADDRPTVRNPATAVTVTGWATIILALLIVLAAMLPGL